MSPLALIAADPGVSPAFQAALVRVSHALFGSGGEITVLGPDRAAVEARAEQEAARYPAEAYGTWQRQPVQVGSDWMVLISWHSGD